MREFFNNIFLKKKEVLVTFTKVNLPYGWLGNMFSSKIRFEGKIWNTSESLFQALRFENEEIKEIIRNEKSPMGAKMKAKKYKKKMVLEPRSERDVLNMKLVVKLKFDQNPNLKSKLKKMKDNIIIEDIGSRRGEHHLFWGMKKVNGQWIGDNRMGIILMKIRDEYLKEEK